MKIAHIVKVSNSRTEAKSNGEAFHAVTVTWSDGRNTTEDASLIKIHNGVRASLKAF